MSEKVAINKIVYIFDPPHPGPLPSGRGNMWASRLGDRSLFLLAFHVQHELLGAATIAFLQVTQQSLVRKIKRV